MSTRHDRTSRIADDAGQTAVAAYAKCAAAGPAARPRANSRAVCRRGRGTRSVPFIERILGVYGQDRGTPKG